MSKRTDKLPDNGLVMAIQRLQADVTDLKNRQRTSGQSGVLGFESQTANTWDLTATVGTSGDTSTITTGFVVTFVGDGTQAFPIVNVTYLVYVNGTDPAHQLAPSASFWTDGTRTAQIIYGASSFTGDVDAASFQLVTLKDVTYYIKAYAYGSSRGTLTVTT